MSGINAPQKQGLYDPRNEHDACGVGFVVDVKGRKSNDIVAKALQILVNMEHRGACGCEQNTGDGAGILLQTPHSFFYAECLRLDIQLPPAGAYAVGAVFLPVNENERKVCETLFEEVIQNEGLEVLGWRNVPTSDSLLGQTARASQPFIRQIFISRGDGLTDDAAFERKLYVIRRSATKAVRSSAIKQQSMFYVASLSHRTLVYKGMLTASQLASFYPDLLDKSLETSLALVHSRFSTNTFPSWARAHPYRYIAHNGEINTLRGNINWMRARESKFASHSFGEDLAKILPVIDADASDSGMFDNVLEMLTLAGRSLPHSLMMMIPEAWGGDTSMSTEKRAFYEYHSCLMEPWDGPAAIAFTDGVRVGAVLDRNGLRPARYYVTSDDLVVLASEVGVLDLPASKIVAKGRLQPGRMFLVDTEQGRIIDDEELKHELATQHPYKDWLDSNIISLEQLPDPPFVHKSNRATLLLRQKAFGFTYEDLKILIKPMAMSGHEAIGSMGTDTPLAVLSNRPQLLFNYFKQLFAQVTNPPVDAIREELIMSADTTIGPEANLLEPSPECCHQIRLRSPILTNHELEKVRLLGDSDGPWGAHGFKTITLSTLFEIDEGGPGLNNAMEDLCHQVSAAISAGYQIIILSDRGITERRAAIPCLLAVAGVHHHLIREGTRTQVGLLVETGEAREVHHFSLLVSYGAAAVNPYLVFETIDEMVQDGTLKNLDGNVARSNFVNAVKKGIVKVISKMGISTTQSYCGAQVFEALGLSQDLVDKYFTGTNSPIGGIGLDILAEEVRSRHHAAFSSTGNNVLTSGGEYQYRSDGERHLFSPATIHKLQQACRLGDYELFKQYSALVNDHSNGDCTLRGRLQLQAVRPAIDLDEVESVESIVRRFKTGAMSYGSISKEAHEALAVAMNRIGGKSNTGEGGEDPARYEPDNGGDSKNSAIKQVASGRFGVTSNYLVHAQEIQIKIAQGAKPGEGGQLSGTKVYPWIAKVRLTTAGVGLISPPPHHDIYSIEDLAQLISDLKNASPLARISVKLVAENGVGTIAAGVAKAKADVILISGYDGGTGAAPLTSIKHTGVPWELGLAETHQTLLLNNLRSRVRLETDGQLKTGRDVVVAALLGAEEFGFATAPLVTLGCIMMRACHLNTCPVGVATQDPKLRARFTGDPSHLVNFMEFIAREVRELMAQLGFRRFDEMVGKVECLGTLESDHWKGKSIDFSRILFKPDISSAVGEFQQVLQDHALEDTLDSTRLLTICQPALKRRQAVSADLKIQNTDRAVGTMLGSELTRQYGPSGLPHDTIQLNFLGSAGQSFAAFLPKGITFRLNGDANDYVGKGLSGGKIIVFPPKAAGFRAEENVIIGNVAFYGATSGEAYIHGLAGERFCVRNSGANVVVHEIGDHGCEYMTGGRVIVLSKTGRNFAAGMSGGIAYVIDEFGQMPERCNQELVSLGLVEDPEELDFIKNMIFRHAEYTGSDRAAQILLAWDEFVPSLVRVLPNDYGRVIDARKQIAASALSEHEAALAVFEMTRSAGQ